MPDRATEVENLALADRHIAEGEARIAEMEALMARALAAGEDATASQQTLAAMREAMVQFEAHRTAIVQTIADIDAGMYGRDRTS